MTDRQAKAIAIWMRNNLMTQCFQFLSVHIFRLFDCQQRRTSQTPTYTSVKINHRDYGFRRLSSVTVFRSRLAEFATSRSDIRTNVVVHRTWPSYVNSRHTFPFPMAEPERWAATAALGRTDIEQCHASAHTQWFLSGLRRHLTWSSVSPQHDLDFGPALFCDRSSGLVASY